MLKICSVKIVPASRVAKSRPKIVTTGTMAARSACLNSTLFVLTPLAWAVRM